MGDHKEQSDPAGRVAVVTGAAGGIGQAIALALGRAGAAVAALDRDAEGAERTAAAVRARGATAAAFTCDLTQTASVEQAAEAVERQLGPCTTLVNNAGVLRPGPLSSLSLAEWNAVLAVDLTGYFVCAQVFGSAMCARRRGSIVHIGSIAARSPQTQGGAYSVAKAGVVMLSAQIAAEWGPDGIRSNVVHPGLIRTPLTERFYRQPGVEARRIAMVPARRIGQPEDVANAVVFLASDAAAYVNGAELLVDGGIQTTLMDLLPRPGLDRVPAFEAEKS